jgi:hypothetical protein
MRKIMSPRPGRGAALLVATLVLAGCSGSTEDVRVTLCKNLTQAALQEAESIEWLANENTFRRPEYAITGLSFEMVGRDGDRSAMTSDCRYAYVALDDTAVHLADPLSAYDNLPYAMTLNGRALDARELLQLVNAEQRRQGRQVLQTLRKGAADAAEGVRAGVGG